MDDPGRLADMSGVGVDEHAWQRANAVRPPAAESGQPAVAERQSSVDTSPQVPGGAVGWPLRATA